jgi:hypothetical protein
MKVRVLYVLSITVNVHHAWMPRRFKWSSDGGNGGSKKCK